ncbi:GNAT family N-acetyltransferase [Evansella sp. AB-rgal1]|uniref:GNAT family N-acetyltransferase n=1 Tax=Evansella sp. AB-rgal1 TaxID=3242696 RepID=UPI00359EAE95
MDFNLKKATVEEKATIGNMMQFYFYDFSGFINIDVEENGFFAKYDYIDSYWEEESRYPYLIEIDGKYAGFALVRFIEEEDRSYFSIAEFFIMKKYRRSGLGKEVASAIFDTHRGQWEVFQIVPNKAAQEFWVKVIFEYTNGNYTDRLEEGKRFQEFTNFK